MTHPEKLLQPATLVMRSAVPRARGYAAGSALATTLQRLSLLLTVMLCLVIVSLESRAQQDPAPQVERPAEALERDDETAATISATAEDAQDADDGYEEEEEEEDRPRRRRRHSDVIIHLGEDSHLPANASAESVVAIFGSASSAGTVVDTVISFFGNTRVEGPVGSSAVALFGNTYVNSRVGDDALAFGGNLELGPEAVIEGDAVAMGGKIIRDPAAVVHGDSSQVSFGERFGGFEGLRNWINLCLLYGRPLAFEPGLGWAWLVALGFLGLYVVIALLFSNSVQRCVDTLETRPGQSAVTSLLTLLLTPVLILLLLASIIGIIIVPFAAIVLFCAGLFGKAVVLAALGRRVTQFTGVAAFSHLAVAVLAGGIIMLALYTVPVLGFIVYKLLGILGLGVVVYTVLLLLRQRQNDRAQARAAETAAPINTGEPTAAATSMEGGSTMTGADAAAASAAMGAAAASAATGETTAAAAAVAATALPRAGFWIRMGALLIDVILVGIVISILDPPGKLMLLALAGYGAVMWKLKGTTIGGIVFGLKLVRRDGRPISWDTAVVRALGCFLSLMLAGLGFLWIVFDEDKQAWHDKIAGTLVVRAPKGESLV